MNLRRRIPIALLSTILLHADGDPGTEVIKNRKTLKISWWLQLLKRQILSVLPVG